MSGLHDLSPEDMINSIEEHRFDLSEWEEEFIDDLTEKIEAEKELSPRQLTKLEEIYERVTK